MFADIIVDIKHEKLDRIFQYRIPEWLKEELNVGMEVVIPFGKGNRQTKGYVVGISETCDYDLSKVKEIEDISRNSVEIEAKLIALAAWMKEHYGGTMIQALKTVLPIKQKENAKIKKYVRLLLGKERAEAQLHYYQQKNQKARARLLEALLEDPVIEYELITKKPEYYAQCRQCIGRTAGGSSGIRAGVSKSGERKRAESKNSCVYGRAGACDRVLLAGVQQRCAGSLFVVRCDRQWKNGSLY